MALAFDATSNSTGGSVTSVTWSHTTSGADRALIVGVSFWNGSTESITGVTYAGTAMTSIGSALSPNNERAQQWKLSNPATGANNVVVSFSSVVDAACGAVSFTGARQTTASLTGTQATATGTSTAPSVNVSSAPGEIVVDTLSSDVGDPDTVGAGQTERWNASSPEADGAGSTEAGAATVTMSWTLGASVPWALVGVGVKSGTTVEPFPGLIQFQGKVPTTAHVKQPVVGKMLLKGYVPTTAHVKQPRTGEMVYVGHVPTIRTISFTSPTAGKFWFVGGIPRADSGRTISPFAQVFSLVGFQPTVTLFYWSGSDPAGSTTWSTTATVSQSWSTISNISSTWSPL